MRLVETSERLRELQKAKLLFSAKPAHLPDVQWYDSVDEIPLRKLRNFPRWVAS